jgi:hypothetical protein
VFIKIYSSLKKLVRFKVHPTSTLSCNFLWSHVIRHDQQNKEKNARQINSTSQSPGASKKDKIKTVLAFINELQVKGSAGSDEEIDTYHLQRLHWCAS